MKAPSANHPIWRVAALAIVVAVPLLTVHTWDIEDYTRLIAALSPILGWQLAGREASK